MKIPSSTVLSVKKLVSQSPSSSMFNSRCPPGHSGYSRPGSGFICHHLVIGVQETKMTMMTTPKVAPIIPNPTKILLRYFDLSCADVSRGLRRLVRYRVLADGERACNRVLP